MMFQCKLPVIGAQASGAAKSTKTDEVASATIYGRWPLPALEL